jgi:hypothetical protein
MRIRSSLLPAVLSGLVAFLGLAAVVMASPTRPQTSSLRFITSGLSCTNGVCALGSGNVGANYGQNIAITGGSCGRPCVTLPAFTVVAGSLPPGLKMPSTYGCCGDAIGGTPSQAGTFNFTIQVKDGAGNTARQAFSIAISPPAPLRITFPTTCCNAGTVGQSYLQNFSLSGGVAPYAASITAGKLPPGLKLSASPPISITGTPTTAGRFTFTVKVTDSKGAQATKQGSITMATSVAVPPPAQAAGSWSAPVQLPGSCGASIAVNAAGAQVTAGFTTGNGSVQACTSLDGQTWSGPVTLAPGISPAVSIAPNGRAVAVWEGGGGPGTAAILQASVRPPGGQWSTAVTLGTDYGQPVIGIDGSGDAIVAWVAANLAIDTASLPAGGKWTKAKTLAAKGQALNLAVNSAGAAIVTWGTRFATLADSGTVLGGFGTPVTVGPPPPYPIGHTHVALNDAGQAALAWVDANFNMAATRSAGGTWSTPTQLSAKPDGPVDVAIDGAGDAIAVFEQFQYAGGNYIATVYDSKRPAGGTWGPPATLSAPGDDTAGTRAVADAAGTFVVGWQDRTTHTLNVLTSPPGGGFGPAATFPDVLGDLKIAPGHAVLTFANSSAPMSVSSEQVS